LSSFTVGRISKPIFNERRYCIVSGGILFVRAPIPKTKISKNQKFKLFFLKNKNYFTPGRGTTISNKAKESGVI